MATVTTVTIDETTQRERTLAVENAIASCRLEGLEPTEGAMAILRRFAEGELDADELIAKMNEDADREFGPVRLPRD